MTFVQEFQKLLLSQPRYNLKQVNAENCDYADAAVKSKNCYYAFAVFYCEDVYYARFSRKCENCCDITCCLNCRWCTNCTDCVNGYMLDYCDDCQNCSECQFCRDCYSCENCFGCVGLYRKKYCIFNEQFTKEEYTKRLAAMNLKDPQVIANVRDRVENLHKSMPHLATHQFLTENCVGDHLSESKNCYQCYDGYALEDCMYSIETNGNKDCCDQTMSFENELCYSCVHCPLNYNCNFIFHTDASSESEFCAFSKNLKNCFGCVYLANKQYYILNKPYSAEEYEREVARIKKELIASGNYNMSPYFASEYEKKRLLNETDPAIQTIISNN